MDDAHGGGEIFDEAITARNQLIGILKTAGLELRKWASNNPDLLEDIPPEHLLSRSITVDLCSDGEKPLKMLGLAWRPDTDSFLYKVPTTPDIRTKRQLASQIGRIYDPVGWVMPVSVFARCIQREVCHAKYEWDDPLPQTVIHDWSKLSRSISELKNLSLPRHVSSSATEQWLIGFADASERAYAAVIYHVGISDGSSTVRLVMSRAKIAPIKPESIPRLELLAAELLSRVFAKVRPLFNHIPENHCIACSDSTIALSWITADPAPSWKVFVGNRVARTLTNLPRSQWFHIRSEDNPADIASRGMLPHQLIHTRLWWEGPDWLTLTPKLWNMRKIRPELDLEAVIGEIRKSSVIAVNQLAHDLDIEHSFSSFERLRRVTAWILRFSKNCRSPRTHTGPLTTEELRSTDLVLVKRAQLRHFAEIHSALDGNRPPTKLMKQLAIFRSSDGLIRVGGRLRHSSLSYETRHPALLPKLDPLTDLIVRQAHERCLHVGPRATLAHLRTRFWIVDGRNLVTQRLSGCVRCFSINPKPFSPEMGQLPSDRVERAFAFENVGVDFCGPFTITMAGLRGARKLDVFLAVFVCLTTKAIHLEVVMDLSTDGFLQCLERFIGRRGVPSIIWSDNGRNFLGSANLLRRLGLLSDSSHKVADQLSFKGITWKFIPPRAPHFGGLWEAAVKSAKRLLKINLRDHTPTLQTFSTISVRIEAILNSRPLVFQSGAPDDILVLTPAHFLVQRPLTALPDNPPPTVSTRLVPKWRFVSRVVTNLWKRWYKEYLSEMQTRQKWCTTARPAKIGDIVLISEDNTPPLSWPIGIIESLYPCADGVARVADVRSAAGSKRRPLVKLCPLPADE